ncbi:MAG: hypothetical protein J7K51_08715 [Thermotogae bacterium]|nr:hypothetical protein [Thermotogota bacterium]
MKKMTLDVDFKEIKKAISKLPDEEKKSLLLEVSPILGRALEKMEKEAIKEDKGGKTVRLEDG